MVRGWYLSRGMSEELTQEALARALSTGHQPEIHHYSLFKNLAGKHKTQKAQVLKKLKQGNEYIYEYEVRGEKRQLRVFKLRHLKRTPNNSSRIRGSV
jgi:hypothetical protein